MNYICIRDRAVWRTFRKSAADDRRELSAQAEHVLCEYLIGRYGSLIADPVTDGITQKSTPVACKAEIRFNDELRRTESIRKFDEYVAQCLADGITEVEPIEISRRTGMNTVMMGRIARLRNLRRIHKRTPEGQRWVYDLTPDPDWAAMSKDVK